MTLRLSVCTLLYAPLEAVLKATVLKVFLIRIRIFDSGSLKYAPTREFAEEIHGFVEYCKYGHVHQAIAKANP